MSGIAYVLVQRLEDGTYSIPLRVFFDPEAANEYCLVKNAEGDDPHYIFPVPVGW